jgi:hypothetical protein
VQKHSWPSLVYRAWEGISTHHTISLLGHLENSVAISPWGNAGGVAVWEGKEESSFKNFYFIDELVSDLY